MSRTATDGMPDVQAVLERLKGFQRSTVEYAFERLYTARDATRRFLVADEVGLGKTLVARGVIAKAIEHMWEDIDRIDIVYICSNGQIAAQNVNRLQIGDSKFIHADRLTLLPTVIEDLQANKVNYLAFTPGTSFDLTRGMGRWEERVLLYHLVQQAWPDPSTGPKNLFQGYVGNPNWWRRQLDVFDAEHRIDKTLARKFRSRLKEVGRLPGWGGEDLRRRYRGLYERFHRWREHMPDRDRAGQGVVIGRLRSLLAEVCVDALKPDLVILDEFQRFKDILDGDSEAAMLAKQLFTFSDEHADVRLLLLSATPYKMYTLHHEQQEDNHYDDFLHTVEFLDPELKNDSSFKGLLERYRQALYRVGEGAESIKAAKNEIEAVLRRVMSRTERIREGGDDGDMLRTVASQGLRLEDTDVNDYLALQRIGREVGQPQVIEYWKSAPYLLNFMDGYKIKTEVVRRLAEPQDDSLAKLLVESERGLLPWDQVEAYAEIDPANARLRHLLEWVESERLWELLWLPPSLPYYRTAGPWSTAARDLTKRLVFSSWAVVPKTLASLLSYEVERRISRRFDSALRNTADERKKRRQLLRFTVTQGRLTGMPVLGILYPSPALATSGDPVRHAVEDESIPACTRVLRAVARELKPRLRELSDSVVDPVNEREDEAWYWAAPILLDMAETPETTRDWFAQSDLADRWAGAEDDDEDDSRWSDHVDLARQVVKGSVQLGRPPADLAEVLATMALAGPAVCALRAIIRVAAPESLSHPAARNAAGEIAWSFRSLFNQPEAMALVRGGSGDEQPYWQQVLDYCGQGHLQAVLDEYVHTVRDLEGLFDVGDETAWESLAQIVGEALSIRTGNPTVDEIRPSLRSVEMQTRRLRTHFAMRFGDQVSEDGKAAREGQVRRAFNSPFWPFVLTSTSVGQEGLDFHNYCHAVVHWNLPANPVDLEQREGRVHRYKGHAVRKNVASACGDKALKRSADDVWGELFEIARHESSDDHGLVPYWLFSTEDGAQIERHVPALPLSRDSQRFKALQRSLAVYRMVFGQPQQDDLLAFLLDNLGEEQAAQLEPELRIDLSPRKGR